MPSSDFLKPAGVFPADAPAPERSACPDPAGPRGCPGPRGPQGPAGQQAPLSDRVDAPDSFTAASSRAVKTAYDQGSEALHRAQQARQSADSAGGLADQALEEARSARELAAAGRAFQNSGLTLYIRVDGNDANDGRADTPDRALATFNGAKLVMRTLDMRGRVLSVKFGPGTHTSGIHLNAGSFCFEDELHICSTDPEHPAVLKTTRHAFTSIRYPVTILLSHLNLQVEDAGTDCMYIDACSMQLGCNLTCAGTGRYAVHACRGSSVYTRDDTLLTVRGNFQSGVSMNRSQFVHSAGNGRIQFESPTFSHAGFYAIYQSLIDVRNGVAGTATGRRYYVNYLSQIHTARAEEGFLPGTVAGVVANGSFYG